LEGRWTTLRSGGGGTRGAGIDPSVAVPGAWGGMGGLRGAVGAELRA